MEVSLEEGESVLNSDESESLPILMQMKIFMQVALKASF